jgi:hypothetical protein
MFLLTDQFGDIHSDFARAGSLPQRHAAALVLRDPRRRGAAGRAPGVDRVELPGRDPAHEPDARPQPRRQDPPGPGLVGKKLGITRERLVTGDALRERVTIVNFAEQEETVDVTLELADDAADIFEVRGYPATAAR